MRLTLLLGALAALLAVSIAGPSHVAADTKKCEIKFESGELKCTLIASPSPPMAVRLSEDLPIMWKRYFYDGLGDLPTDPQCVRTNAGIRELGAIWIVTLVNVDTSAILHIATVCEWPGGDPPHPPPPPPTPGRLAEDNAQTLTLAAVVSPAIGIGGLTGLDSWLWCDDPGVVAANANLDGWTASGSVSVVEIGWEIDGPSGIVANTQTCGSEQAPAVTWMPETMGDYAIVVTTVWAGTWDLTWNDLPMGTYPLGPLALTAPAVAYPVDEYRGVLTG